MKIAIYTLCKNEEQHIPSWMEHIQDADYIIVGDTGSTDNSVAMLKAYGAQTHHIAVTPWRFDTARNVLLELIPNDVDLCISLDFDERLCIGWRKLIENEWTNSMTRMSYRYHEIETTPSPRTTTIITSRIHHRHFYQWRYPVHELLQYIGEKNEVVVYNHKLLITHRPNATKNRDAYIPLMELAVQEDPNHLRLLHQLGVEYLKQKQWDKAIAIFNLNIEKPHVTFEQKCACKRFIARIWSEADHYQKAIELLKEIVNENPSCSSSYTEYVNIAYKNEKWDDIISISHLLHRINFNYTSPYNEYINAKIILHDLMSLAYYHKKDYINALKYAEVALKCTPSDQRIKNNAHYFRHMCLTIQNK